MENDIPLPPEIEELVREAMDNARLALEQVGADIGGRIIEGTEGNKRRLATIKSAVSRFFRRVLDDQIAGLNVPLEWLTNHVAQRVAEAGVQVRQVAGRIPTNATPTQDVSRIQDFDTADTLRTGTGGERVEQPAAGQPAAGPQIAGPGIAAFEDFVNPPSVGVLPGVRLPTLDIPAPNEVSGTVILGNIAQEPGSLAFPDEPTPPTLEPTALPTAPDPLPDAVSDADKIPCPPCPEPERTELACPDVTVEQRETFPPLDLDTPAALRFSGLPEAYKRAVAQLYGVPWAAVATSTRQVVAMRRTAQPQVYVAARSVPDSPIG